MRTGIAIAALLCAAWVVPPAAPLAVAGTFTLPAGSGFSYQYNLADFTGTIPFMGVRVRLDIPHDESYVQLGNSVRVFSPSGMEIHSFLIDPALGRISDLAVDEEGDIYLLAYKPDSDVEGKGFFLLRCDFRGEPTGEIVPTGLPAEFESFGPNTLIYDKGRFYLASSVHLLVAVLDKGGVVQQVLNLADLAGLDPEQRTDAQFGGFAVDRDGRMIFSLPTDFSVRIVSADGTYRVRFGEGGSKRGQFGVAGAVASDADGNLYVADKLRNVVMIFDASRKLVQEIGGYGNRPEDLVIPSDVAVSPSGKLFVSQMRKRGVSVFVRARQEGQG